MYLRAMYGALEKLFVLNQAVLVVQKKTGKNFTGSIGKFTVNVLPVDFLNRI